MVSPIESYPSIRNSITSSGGRKGRGEMKEDKEKEEGSEDATINSPGVQMVRQKHNKVSTFLLAQRRVPPVPEVRTPSPLGTANYFSILFFAWVGPLLRTGYSRYLELNDIWCQNDNRKVEHSVEIFNKKYKQYKANGSTSPYLKALGYALRWQLFAMCVFFALYAGGEICLSVISRPTTQIISEIYEGDTSKRHHAVAFAVGNFLVNLGFVLAFVWYQYYSRLFSEIVRTTIIACIYQKILLLSPHGRAQFPANMITSLITVDTNRIYMAARWTSAILLIVPVMGTMVALLIDNLGVSALPGFGLVLIGIVLNIYLSRFIAEFRKKSIPYADKRIASVRDTIENMRIIKYYGWEDSFVKMISKDRSDEARLLERIGRVTGCIDAITTSVPLYAGMLSFALVAVIRGDLNPARVFPSLTLFTIFIPMSMFFSNGVNTHRDAWPSVLRIEAFFNADEDGKYIKHTAMSSAIDIVNGIFKWESDREVPALRGFRKRVMQKVFSRATKFNNVGAPELDVEVGAGKYDESLSPSPTFALRDVQLRINKGDLIMVVGPIGTGKSSLLAAIAGDMCKFGGSICVDGDVTSVMNNWSLNATIRENILFGQAYDAQKYAEVTHVCSLESDFSAFESRDFSEIGERGITLSGGQKARLALARGVYNVGDIILLDDVLSAVDAKVGKQIFEKCITGYLKSKTRIMVTHNLKLLPTADKIVYMDGSGKVMFGTMEELRKVDKFREMCDSKTTALHDNPVEEESDTEVDEPVEGLVATKMPTLDDDLKRQLSRAPQSGTLMEAERRNKGAITGRTFRHYLSMGSRFGSVFLVVIVGFQAMLGAASVMQSVWLNWWSSNRYGQPKGWYIGFYGLILSGRSISYMFLVFSVASFCFTSSSTLHNLALENIYRAPMSYFDATPLGRIISRFTDDIANLDSLLFMQLRMFLFSTSMLLASVIVVFVYVPWTILCLVPIFVGVLVFLSYFRCSSREIKRINSLFKSKMFSHISETISGLDTILSFNRVGHFQQILHQHIDDMNVSATILVTAQIWLSLRCMLCAIPISLIVSMLCVYHVFDVNASSVGMLLQLIPQVVIAMALGIPMFTELENQMNSIERIYELACEIPQEAPYDTPEGCEPPPENWPSAGRVEYVHASLRYRPSLPLALSDCSLDIAPGSKVGICGRTGAGKSTLLSSLFRITELSSGSIVVDGVDIATIGLRDLRARLSIIPQDPILFEGSIRFNLDPFSQRSDVELWTALHRCGVSDESETSKFHLDAKVASGGTNFSLGERQLLTLARALVRNSKVIVLDEATANVDHETDMMIQRIIVSEFAQRTVLCIAHRLQTILHYDLIVVMDQGKVKEVGRPIDLWNDFGSMFRSMCDEANLSAKDISMLARA